MLNMSGYFRRTNHTVKTMGRPLLGGALELLLLLAPGCATTQTQPSEQTAGPIAWLFGDGSGLKNCWQDSYGDLRSR